MFLLIFYAKYKNRIKTEKVLAREKKLIFPLAFFFGIYYTVTINVGQSGVKCINFPRKRLERGWEPE